MSICCHLSCLANDLKEQSLCCNDKRHNRKQHDCFQSLRKPAKKGVWPEEEVEQLRTLYEEYKNSEDEGNIVGFGKVVPMAARRFVDPPLQQNQLNSEH